MRLLTMGMPYLLPISRQTRTMLAARLCIFMATLRQRRSMSGSAQSSRLMPSVTVRTSRCSSWNMRRVLMMSSVRCISALARVYI